MEYVDAIRDIKQINAIKKLLKDHSARDYLLFVLGINTGLKISEILSIRIKDIKNEKGIINSFLKLELCSKEAMSIYLNAKVKKALTLYLSSTPLEQDDYLFKSSKTNQSITRQHAYRVINKAAKDVGIEGKIGTHSMRKTFGFHAYKKGVAVSLLQQLFNHSSSTETLKYLGIYKVKIQSEIDVNL